LKKDYKNKEWLYQRYVVDEIEPIDIAKEFNVDRKVIIYWLDEFSIYRDYKRLIRKVK
jgi:predicted regulator of amino acid metabolism with ACT domain